jgi:hypothetical protein
VGLRHSACEVGQLAQAVGYRREHAVDIPVATSR